MDYFKYIEKRKQSNLKHGDDKHPQNSKQNVYPRIGVSGYDKNLKLNDLIEIAYNNFDNPKPNIIVKAGPNAKWYLKYCNYNDLDHEIDKVSFNNKCRCTMYIIKWE